MGWFGRLFGPILSVRRLPNATGASWTELLQAPWIKTLRSFQGPKVHA